MVENRTQEELIGKYRAAGNIRLISAFVLFLFLSLMKWIGGYTYLNTLFIFLIFVEAIINQPYDFIIRRVNINRFQYYQMAVDIIAISWVLYYMGGIDAPVIAIAYYAVILWAGVTSTSRAVFFAVTMSALGFLVIVLLEHNGMLLPSTVYKPKTTNAKLFSLLFGQTSYLFAFGYFSAHSSRVIKRVDRKRRDESLMYAHKFLAIDHIIANTTHDISGRLANIKCAVEIFLTQKKWSKEEKENLEMIIREDDRVIDLLYRLSGFSRKGQPEFKQTNINTAVEEAVKLVWPLVRYSKTTIEQDLDPDLPLIMANAGQIQEVVIAIIFNALDAITVKGTLNIKTRHDKAKGGIEIILSDDGVGISKEYLGSIYKPFFTTKKRDERLGIGLAISHEIIEKHQGSISVKSSLGIGTTFTIQLPAEQVERG